MKGPFVLGIVVLLLSRVNSLAIGAGRLPGDTITNDKGTNLQYNVRNNVLAIERRFAPASKYPRVINTAIVGQPVRLNAGRTMRWDERWTVDRCGADAVYFIHFDFRGSLGTYKIKPPAA